MEAGEQEAYRATVPVALPLVPLLAGLVEASGRRRRAATHDGLSRASTTSLRDDDELHALLNSPDRRDAPGQLTRRTSRTDEHARADSEEGRDASTDFHEGNPSPSFILLEGVKVRGRAHAGRPTFKTRDSLQTSYPRSIRMVQIMRRRVASA